MSVDYYQSGFFTGQRGAVGRPPYDPRDSRTMIFVNQYNQGYDAGCRVALGALIRLHSQLDPKPPRSNRQF